MRSSGARSRAWFVAAAIFGVGAIVAHLYRGVNGGSPALTSTVAAYALTSLAVIGIYRGIILAARSQDESPRLARWDGLKPRGR